MTSISVEAQVAASTAFAENLKFRVLALAHIPAADLPERAREVLDARIATLILERKVNQQALEAAAVALARQFPGAVSAHRSESRTPKPSPSGSLKPLAKGNTAKSVKVEALHHQHQQLQHSSKNGSAAPSRQSENGTPSPASPQRAQSPSGRVYFVEPMRASVHRKRQLAKADAEYLINIQRETESFAADEERRRQERLVVKERMRQDMALEAEIRQQRLAAEREERQRLRAQVQRTTEEIRLADEMDEARRKQKLAKEKEAIEEQRQARRAASEAAERRRAAADARYRAEVVQGLHLDEDLKRHRDRDVRATLLSYLEESKEILHHKRETQKQERAAAARQNASSTNIFLGGEQPSVARGLSVPVPARVQALCQLQEHVGKSYATIAEENRQKMLSLEAAALEAERKTAEEQVKRNQMEIAKARSMRAALVASLDLELRIQHEREAHEKTDKVRLRKLVDQSTEQDRAAAQAEAELQARRRIELNRHLAAQVEEREHLSMSPQPIKHSDRPPRFLSKTPS